MEGTLPVTPEVWDSMTPEQQDALLKAEMAKQKSLPSLTSIAPQIEQEGVKAVKAKGAEIAAEQAGVSLPGVGAGLATGIQQFRGAQNAFRDEKLSTTQQAALALPTFGLSFLANKFLGRGESHLEEKARQKLAEQGVNVPNSGVKEWENNPIFKESRNEADLTGKDIINSASLWSLPGYSALDDAHREAVANEALKRQLVREHNGGIDVAADEEFNKFLQSQTPTQTQSSSRDSGNSQQAAVQKKQRKQALLSSLIPEFSRAPDYGAMPNPVVKNPYL